MASTTLTERDVFLANLEREFETTLRVLRAYPEGKDDFKPAEKSASAVGLVWTLVRERQAGLGALTGQIDFTVLSNPIPVKTVKEAIARLEAVHADFVKAVRAASDSALDRAIDFPAGPGKMMKVRTLDFLNMMMMDNIHHRGQFSVYLRLVGARVPSIYGPTADEPWW